MNAKNNNAAGLKELESACRRNAVALLREAKVLLDADLAPRSYFLAITCLEELAKVQLIADVLDGAQSLAAMKAAFRRHTNKFAYRRRTATGDSYADTPMVFSELSKGEELAKSRELALYVDYESASFMPVEPSKSVTPATAASAIQACEDELSMINLLDLLPGGPTTRNALELKRRSGGAA
ncbi:MAG: AbiV family abortive infection protein [Thermoanaerobaculales bacterium]